MRRSWLALALLGGCTTVDLGNELAPPGLCAPDRQYYEDVVWPEFLAPADAARSCVAVGGCHDATNAPRSSLRLDPDVASPGVHDANYQIVTRFLNCASPMSSPLVTYPLAGIDDSHGGGEIFPDTDDPAVSAFESWFP